MEVEDAVREAQEAMIKVGRRLSPEKWIELCEEIETFCQTSAQATREEIAED